LVTQYTPKSFEVSIFCPYRTIQTLIML